MKYLIYTTGVFLVLLTGCGSKKPDPTPEVKPPVAAELVFPAQNSTCISGDVISATQSSVVLKWKAAQNAESYDVTIKNLLTAEITTQSSTVSQVTATLARNTPYAWYVTSKSSAIATTANSSVWKFYNSGDGILSYAPFPADSLSPASGVYITMPATSTVKLSWHGSDTDNDIVDYDVYFGITASPGLYKQNFRAESIDGVPVVAKTKYYWKVVTRDSKNNTSTSGLVQFDTN